MENEPEGKASPDISKFENFSITGKWFDSYGGPGFVILLILIACYLATSYLQEEKNVSDFLGYITLAGVIMCITIIGLERLRRIEAKERLKLKEYSQQEIQKAWDKQKYEYTDAMKILCEINKASDDPNSKEMHDAVENAKKFFKE